MRASRLPQACLSGQAQGAGGSGCPKKTHPCKWTLVFPNWSRYRRNSITWLQLQWDIGTAGLWFFKYCKKVFQSLLFWDSYRLSGGGAGGGWLLAEPSAESLDGIGAEELMLNLAIGKERKIDRLIDIEREREREGGMGTGSFWVSGERWRSHLRVLWGDKIWPSMEALLL